MTDKKKENKELEEYVNKMIEEKKDYPDVLTVKATKIKSCCKSEYRTAYNS